MQKIKFLDDSTHEIESIEIKNGNLEITFGGTVTAEEVQAIFADKARLSTITLLTASGAVSGYQYGYVCYSGLSMSGDEKKVILTKETDKDSERITSALANSLSAEVRAAEAETRAAAAEERTVEVLEKVVELETENATLKEQQTELKTENEELKSQQRGTEVALTDVEIAVLELQERIGEQNAEE